MTDSLSDVLKQNISDNAGSLKLTAQDLESNSLTWLLDNLITDAHLQIDGATAAVADDGTSVSGSLPLPRTSRFRFKSHRRSWQSYMSSGWL